MVRKAQPVSTPEHPGDELPDRYNDLLRSKFLHANNAFVGVMKIRTDFGESVDLLVTIAVEGCDASFPNRRC